MKETYFVTFRQNNSGGYFIENENVGMFVIIEGEDLHSILDKARDVFHDYREYCQCCGERWDDNWKGYGDLKLEPLICGTSVYEYTSWFGGQAIIYRLNGTKEVVNLINEQYEEEE